jgi:hypothetical protein
MVIPGRKSVAVHTSTETAAIGQEASIAERMRGTVQIARDNSERTAGWISQRRPRPATAAGRWRTDEAIAIELDRESIGAFDQKNGRRDIRTVKTGRSAKSRPRTTQGDARQRKVERAMGIEPSGEVLRSLGNTRFGATANPKCDQSVNFRGMWGNVGTGSNKFRPLTYPIEG